ncbi:MAG: hypothetical protein KBB61_02075 [Paludibacteraceae bacterium]|jgi:hypothetical protein|nr:hypothetical protein [Paludibacteraceae bacterium]HHT61680.1 hypothetical protein [Bacteroidales bacterium]MBP9039082.1 hypothetical protein [Paludibacteraceae bacterium]HOA46150.1 hypothetical protein [Paludibacteraceae bacterium]HOH71167.1 hypothetical protein [Paludibacteraceae bacterium]
MLQFINKISKISLWVLFAISMVIGVLFFVGGSTQIDIAGNMWNSPKFTDALIYWAYTLCILTVVITLGIQLMRLILNFKNDFKKALNSLISIIGIIGLFAIAWFLGDGETKLDIIGYEGTDNVGFWAQYSDMCLYLIYMFMGAVVLAMIGSYIYVKVKDRK